MADDANNEIPEETTQLLHHFEIGNNGSPPATPENKMNDKDKRQGSACFVEVVGPDGAKKRFAKGTKASFAVERFNFQLKDPYLPVVCIVASKEGEPPIEFGHDVELVLYDESWTLKTLREAQRENPIGELKEKIKEGAARAVSSLNPSTQAPWAPIGLEATNTDQKRTRFTNPASSTKLKDLDPMLYFGAKNWEDLYPGGKLPEGGSQDCSPAYIGKVILLFFFVFAFAGGISYILERMPEPSQPFS